MDPISRVDQVVLLLRQQLAARMGPQSRTAQKGAAETAPAGTAGQPLQEILARRLAELRASGLTSRSSLTRLLLEEILTAQFGHQLVNDAAFQRVVEDIQAAVEGDDELKDAVTQLLDLPAS